MTIERVHFPRPIREGIGAAIARAYPLPREDEEAEAERRIVRRVDLKEAVRG